MDHLDLDRFYLVRVRRCLKRRRRSYLGRHRRFRARRGRQPLGRVRKLANPFARMVQRHVPE